jgi:flagellar motor switch protein FliG
MSDTKPLTGVQKAAVVIMQLSQPRAAEILRRLGEAEAEEIAAEIVRMRHVDENVAESALREFHERSTAGRKSTRGGRDLAAGLLEASFGSDKATGLLQRLTSSMGGKAFEFLDAAEATQVANLLDGELPETIALVLAHLGPQQASAVVARLAPEVKADVAQAIATMGSAAPEAVAVVADTLRHRARAVVPQEQVEIVGGVQPLVEIINRADVGTERDLLAALDARDPQLAEEVRSRMLAFEDIVRFESRDVQQILRGVQPSVLALAIKGAPEAVSTLIRENMTERNRELLDDELGMLGAVRKTQVDEARAEVVRQIRQLESEGVVSLIRADEEEEELVE